MAKVVTPFPSTPKYASASQSKKHYQLKSESINGRVQVRSLGASRRSWNLTWPPMTRAEFDTIYTYIDDNLEGMLNSFDISLPDPKNPGTNQTVECRISNMVQEFEIGVDNLVSFELEITEVL